MSQKPDISVVVPTRNRPRDLREALESVFAQGRRPEEIIVVDDGSNPPVSGEIFKGCPGETRARLFRNDRPMGANSARNLGIRQASCTWIAFLDDDDRFRPGKIEAIARAAQQEPEADLIYHPAEIRMVNEGVSYITEPGKFNKHPDTFRALLIKNLVGGTSMAAVRREALIRAGLFDNTLPALQDYELWLRMAGAGCRFHFIDTPLTTYFCFTRGKSISQSIENSRKAVELIESRYKEAYRNLTKKELADYEAWKKRILIRKALLNGHTAAAFKEQLKQLASKPGPQNLMVLAAILTGRKFAYMLRARFG